MKLTPTQQRIYDVLADGGPHTLPELIACLWDEQNTKPYYAVAVHISNIRKALGPQGLDVTVRGKNGSSVYRLMRYVGPGE